MKGEEALALGLANYLVQPEELLDFCRNYIVDLATKCSPASMAVMKRQVYEQLHAGLGPAEREAQRLMVASFGRPDFKEGVRSFVEKRPPQFPRIGDCTVHRRSHRCSAFVRRGSERRDLTHRDVTHRNARQEGP